MTSTFLVTEDHDLAPCLTVLFLAVKSRWIRSGDLILSCIRGEQQGCEGMLSPKAPLSQGADPPLGEEGRTHPRATALAIPGAWLGTWGHSIGNDPSVA